MGGIEIENRSKLPAQFSRACRTKRKRTDSPQTLFVEQQTVGVELPALAPGLPARQPAYFLFNSRKNLAPFWKRGRSKSILDSLEGPKSCEPVYTSRARGRHLFNPSQKRF